MSDEVERSNNLNSEKKLVENISTINLNPKNEITLSKENLNETNSPKVTIETFSEYSQTKLRDVFFSGVYEDRVYVETLKGYRDRVIIDDEETRFLKCLKSVLKRGRKLQGENFQGIKSKFYKHFRIHVLN